MKTNLKTTLDFLGKLEAHNNREWFEKNRAEYEQAREAFEIFVDTLIRDYGRVENLKGVSAKDCIFRIYRDVRFAKDKSPYKTNMGAEIVAGGRKTGRVGYYVHVAPYDESMIAGGLYMPSGEQIAKFRQAIARNAAPFKKIIAAKDFKKYFGTLIAHPLETAESPKRKPHPLQVAALEPAKLKTAPMGYARDHPEIELLKWKQVVVMHRISDKQVFAPNLASYTVGVFEAMKPFLDYLNSVVI